MKVDPEIKIKVLPGVYDPSDDTYLLIESIDLEKRGRALDMGCGTGIIALHLAKSGFEVVAVDINDCAVRNAILNSELNNIRIDIIKSDLFKNIAGKFDLIVFNPPYLPTREEDLSWDGGGRGIKVIDRFLEDAYKYLAPGGRIYIIMSSLTDSDRIIKKYGNVYEFRVVGKRHMFFEDIFCYEIRVKQKCR